MPAHQRLEQRARQLSELAVELEEHIRSDTPREFLCVYSWAIDYIAIELKVLSDRLEIQEKLRKSS